MTRLWLGQVAYAAFCLLLPAVAAAQLAEDLEEAAKRVVSWCNARPLTSIGRERGS